MASRTRRDILCGLRRPARAALDTGAYLHDNAGTMSSMPLLRRNLLAILVSLAACACDGRSSVPVPGPGPAKTSHADVPASGRVSVVDNSVTPTVTTSRVPAPARLVAIGDVHGDLEATRAALRLAGAIDEQERWIGKELVVVQTGDQLDRGDGERQILDLLERLQVEARAAGGAMHVLNGNHELMNAAGDLRYVTAGGYVDFADVPGVDLNDPRAATAPPAMRGRLLAFAPGGPYARKLATRPIILVIGDTVFAHAGVLPEHVGRGIDAINAETQRWLRGEGEISPGLLLGDESPLWTRRFCQDPGPQDCAVASETLTQLGIKRMVVGHTVHKDGIVKNCDGKVWCIDVGMASYYGGHPEVLEIVGDQVKPLRAGP